jgi:hypothetical protein
MSDWATTAARQWATGRRPAEEEAEKMFGLWDLGGKALPLLIYIADDFP